MAANETMTIQSGDVDTAMNLCAVVGEKDAKDVCGR